MLFDNRTDYLTITVVLKGYLMLLASFIEKECLWIVHHKTLQAITEKKSHPF